MTTFTVWSLDVWGHSGSECCASYDCHKGSRACVSVDDDGNETHDDNRCECHYDVNDRSRAGEVEIDDDADDTAILAKLDADGFIHADKCEIDDYSDGSTFDVVSKETHRPLLVLESAGES